MTQETASLEDLLPLAASKLVKPRPTTAASIPGMLGTFHDEWDALTLGTYTLRQQLHTVRAAPRSIHAMFAVGDEGRW